MSRLTGALLLLLLSMVGCGQVERVIGHYKPELNQAGAAGQANEPAADLSKPWPSSGCGKSTPSEQIATVPGTRTGFTPFQIEQTGATLDRPDPTGKNPRQFLVRVPADYDPNRPYRIVYLARGACDGEHPDSTETYPLFDESRGGSEQAVYVDVATPVSGLRPGCYDTTSANNSVEWEAFDLIHSFVESNYCVDNNRIFVAGYSQGGALANFWGCYFAGVPDPPRRFSPKWALRGHAAVAGWREANQPLPCSGPGAGFWLHDSADVSQGEVGSNPAALALALQSNGCVGEYNAGPKAAWPAAENIAGLGGGACQRYGGCPAQVGADYPLVFCDVAGDGQGDHAELAIPAFTAFFNTMDPTP